MLCSYMLHFVFLHKKQTIEQKVGLEEHKVWLIYEADTIKYCILTLRVST